MLTPMMGICGLPLTIPSLNCLERLTLTSGMMARMAPLLNVPPTPSTHCPMVYQTLIAKAGLTFFGNFVLEKKDPENKALLNLKGAGTLPLIEAVRIYSIKNRVNKGGNTIITIKQNEVKQEKKEQKLF